MNRTVYIKGSIFGRYYSTTINNRGLCTKWNLQIDEAGTVTGVRCIRTNVTPSEAQKRRTDAILEEFLIIP